MRMAEQTPIDILLHSPVKVVNIGLREFAKDMASCNVPVVHVDWSPPAVTDPRIASLLAKLGG
jgi:FdrA protein